MRLAAIIGALALTLNSYAGNPKKGDVFDFSSRSLSTQQQSRLDSAEAYGLPRAWLEVSWAYINAVELGTQQSRQDPILPQPPTFSGDSSLHLPNVSTATGASFFFASDSSSLTAHDSADVIALAQYYHSLGPEAVPRILVEARADSTFTATYNLELSRRRGDAVAGLLKQYLPRTPIESVSFGNASPLCAGGDSLALAKNRVVRVLPSMTAAEAGLEEVLADYVFIDNSGSMGKPNKAGYVPWNVVVSFPFAEDDRVYLFSKRTGYDEKGNRRLEHLKDHNNITGYYPNGQTPLKDVMAYVSLIADPGTRFLFLTDGDASKSVFSYDQIVKVAKERDISFSFVGAGLTDEYLLELQEVALATDGQVYTAAPNRPSRLADYR